MAVLHGVAAVSELSSSAEETTRVQVIDSVRARSVPMPTVRNHCTSRVQIR